MAQGPISDYGKLRSILQKAKNIVVLTGAGTSAESGIPTFRGAGGLWRTYQATDLATPGAFNRSPALVWEFYHYRRELVLTKKPNKAHLAIADAERILKGEGRKLTVITQNIDGLHQRAGSHDVIELHGSLFKTLCTKCQNVDHNNRSPICPALQGKGAPDPDAEDSEIPVDQLPRCEFNSCGGLLRPYVVWFGESLHPDILEQSDKVMEECDACLVVGTSSVVYPAAMFAPSLAAKGVPVAEFNMEKTPATSDFMFHFEGPCTESIPEALKGITADPLTTSSLTSKDFLLFFLPSFLNSTYKTNYAKDKSNPTTNPHSLSSNSIETEKKEQSNDERLSGAQKLKQAVTQYGSTVIVFHIGMSLMSLGAFYTAFSSGLDMSWLINSLGLEGKVGDVASGASTFVIAYAVHKVFAPVRISITIGAAPFIVRYLRNIGFLKKPKSQSSQ